MSTALDAHLPAYTGGSIYNFDNTIQLKWYPERIAMHSRGATSLLELGLGHGITADAFHRHFRRHVVVDASPAVIANYRQTHPGTDIEIVESYFEAFETDERFEVIVCGYVLEHIDDPVLVLERMRRFLAPGGHLYATVPNAEVLNRRLGHIAGMLPDILALSDHDRLLGHKRYYTIETFKRDIEQAGYRIEKLEGIYLKPLATQQMLSLHLDDKIIEALCVAAIDYPELSCGLLAKLTAP